MVTWYPDFCPSGNCMIELEKVGGSLNWATPKRLITLCPHHQNVKDTLALSDTGVFTAILQSSRFKERARWEAKLELGLDKEDPGVAYRVEPNGDFVIMTGASGFQLAAIRSRIAQATATLPKPKGTSLISIE